MSRNLSSRFWESMMGTGYFGLEFLTRILVDATVNVRANLSHQQHSYQSSYPHYSLFNPLASSQSRFGNAIW